MATTPKKLIIDTDPGIGKLPALIVSPFPSLELAGVLFSWEPIKFLGIQTLAFEVLQVWL